MTDKPIYRMSSAGYCPRALSATRLNMVAEQAPKYLESSAKEGNWHETRIKYELHEQDYTVYSEQEEIKIKQELYDLVGHIDGKVEKENVVQLLEVKSMSQYEFDRWMAGGFTAFPQYAAQIACYSYATNIKKVLYIVKNRNNGFVDRRELDLEQLNGLFQIEGILEKLNMIELLVQAGELTEAEFDSSSIECKRCKYKYLCLPEPKAIEDIDMQILHDNIERYREAIKAVKKAQAIADDAKSILQMYASEQPEKKFRLDDMSISVFEVAEKEISYVRKAYTSCMIKDLRKEE